MTSLPTTEAPPLLSTDDLPPLQTLSTALALTGVAQYGSVDYGIVVANTTVRTPTYSVPIPSSSFRNGTALRITAQWLAVAGAPTSLIVGVRVGPSSGSPQWTSIAYNVVDDPYAFIDVTIRLRKSTTPSVSVYNAVLSGFAATQDGIVDLRNIQGYTPDPDDAVWLTFQWSAADPNNTGYGLGLTVEIMQPSAVTS